MGSRIPFGLPGPGEAPSQNAAHADPKPYVPSMVAVGAGGTGSKGSAIGSAPEVQPTDGPKIRKGSRTDRAGRPGFWTLHAVSAVWTLQLRRRPLHALYGVGIAWPEETYGLRRANGMGLEIILSNCIKELSS